MPGVLRRAAVALLRTAFFATHGRHDVHGKRVLISDPHADKSMVLADLKAAILVLENVNPKLFGAVLRYVGHIIVWPGDYTAYDSWGGVHLSAAYLRKAPAEIIASGLVHEYVHLRVERCGISYEGEARARIETLCVRHQAAFLRETKHEHSEAWALEAEIGLKDRWWE